MRIEKTLKDRLSLVYLFELLVFSLFFLTACGSSAPSAEASASAATSEPEDADSNTAEGFDLISGEWVIGAIYKDGERYDLSDPKYSSLLDLYDSQSLDIDESGAFLYRNNIFFTEGQCERSEETDTKTGFHLTSERVYRLAMEDGQMVEKDATGGSDYLIEVAKTDGEVTLVKIDSETGEPDKDDYIYVLQKGDVGDSAETESSDEFETVQIGPLTCQIPANWICLKSEDNGDTVVYQCTPSESEKNSNRFVFMAGKLEGSTISSEADAVYVMETSFTESNKESDGYTDVTCRKYTGWSNPAIYGTSTSSEGVKYDTYYAMANAGREIYLISYIRRSGQDEYLDIFEKILASVEIPAFDTGTSSQSSPSSTEKPAPSASATSGERNALERAESYLRYSAFSYSGLIDQLEYEGFTSSEATYGADHCGADWNEQALKKAQSYLDYSAFSYSGLVDQLEYEGFTSSEATYGADHCGADWNEQAAKKAKQYLEYSSFSRSDLIDQLEYEGFTASEANYGVSIAY